MPREMPDLAYFTLLTSNADKIREFSSFGLSNLTFAKGPDIEEVDGTPDEVIVYKAIAAGAKCIVEDSVVLVDGEPMVDIRWNLAELGSVVGKPIDFEVRLGVNDGSSIHVFKGKTSGRIVEPRGEGGFGFDPFFEVNGTGMTLAELAADGLKDVNSPRLEAIRQLLSWEADFSTELKSVSAWRGPMQGH
jgi:inosine/xanthosine triphosphate pyrophosphatase family protein